MLRRQRPAMGAHRTRAAASSLLVLGVLLVGLFSGRAAVPPAEKLLPDDTLVLVTAPDWPKLAALYRESPSGRFWSDPAMAPLKERFLSRWREELVKPLERELGVSFDSYALLLQGQVTLAITRSGSPGSTDQTSGFLLLLDTKDKGPLLRTNLAALRKQWADAGKPVRTERLRDLDFSVYPISSNTLPKALRKMFPLPYDLLPPPGASGAQQAPASSDAAAGNIDLVFDTIGGLLFGGHELVVGQADSLLVVGNSLKAVEKVATRLTGGALPAVGELAAYQEDYQAMFRDAPFYGWVNVKAFVDAANHKPPEKPAADAPDPFDVIPPEKVITATGLGSVKAIAFSLQPSKDGLRLQLSVNVPEATRQGLFRVLAGEAKETTPPPFVPADAVNFQRWRLDGQKAWSTIEQMLTDASSQTVGTLNWILETAGARAKEKDPGFDLKKMLVGNLGDDIITYEVGARGESPAELRSPPSILLLGSPSPEQLTAALKALFVIFPQGDTITEREFLGRKIYSVPMPPTSMFTGTPAKPTPARILNFTVGAGYVALSTDVTLLESYLRSSESPPKPLREKAGLAEAADKVRGAGTCLFHYANQAEATRAAFDAMKKDPTPLANAGTLGLFPGFPELAGTEKHFTGWIDYSLAPPFEKVAQYFSFSVYALSANTQGFTLKVLAPTPPAASGKSLAKQSD
jgi:hypothetical protein